jgi:hypothetical protein
MHFIFLFPLSPAWRSGTVLSFTFALFYDARGTGMVTRMGTVKYSLFFGITYKTGTP